MASESMAAEGLSDFWKRACAKLNAVDVLKGTGLESMGEDLKFWCYRIDNAFNKPSMHQELVELINKAFDPDQGGGLGVPRRQEVFDVK